MFIVAGHHNLNINLICISCIIPNNARYAALSAVILYLVEDPLLPNVPLLQQGELMAKVLVIPAQNNSNIVLRLSKPARVTC